MLSSKCKLLSLGPLALTGCILAGMLPYTHAAPEPDTLTIASYNIAGNMAIPSQLLAQDMTSHGVDIAGLQEVDKLTSRNNHDVPVEIAQEMGEEYSSFFGKSIDFGGGEYGNAIVSRYAFQETDHALFPDNGYEGRSWSKVVVEVDGKSIAFYGTHLSYETTEARQAQIEELIQIVDADPTPYKVITGDFNTDQSTSEFYSFLYNYNLANGHNNEWIDTYAGYDPNMKTNAIDNIITTRNMRLVEVDTYRREEGKTSDHRMLYATYELLEEEVPSTQLLDIRIQEAQDLMTQSDAYTPETVAALREALDQALHGTRDTQEQINALVRALEQAMDGLEELVEPAVPVAYYSFDDGTTRDLIADSHGEDQGNPASTGDATSSLPFCIGADSKGNYRTKAQYDEVKVYHEALTPEQVVLAAQLPHTHQATQVEEKAATCTQDGNIAYWYCADCGKYFSDKACTVEITPEDTVVPATGHHYENGVCVDCGEKEPDHGQANKPLLQKTYDYALTLSTEGVTDSAKAAFETALDAAKKVTADGDAMDEDIQPAAEALLNAILAQRYKADKSILEDLIGKAQGINLDGYTAESVAVFRSALANAQTVMANESLSEDDQATVDAAVAALSDAMNGLTAGGAPETTDKPEASEKPETTDKPQTTQKPETNVPQTGDTQVMGLWLVLSLGAVSCLSVMALRQRRR